MVVVALVLALVAEGGGVFTVGGATFVTGGVVGALSDVAGLEFTGVAELAWAVCSGGDTAVEVGEGVAGSF